MKFFGIASVVVASTAPIVGAFQPPAFATTHQRKALSPLASTTDQGSQKDVVPTPIVSKSPANFKNSAPRALGGAASAVPPVRESPADLVASRSPKVKVQGGSLKTWSYASPQVQRIHVALKTEGRPLDADISLWQGPDNTPHKMRIYVEDGAVRPFSAVIETPRGPNTVQIRNTAQLEFPLEAHVMAEDGSKPSPLPAAKANDLQGPPLTIQGGALRTYPFDQSVEQVQVLLKTDGRPLRSRIELLQGPNNNKQVVEVYTEDGLERPVYMVIETPGDGNVVRIVNSHTVEFPLTAWVEPYSIGEGLPPTEPVIGGDDGRGFGKDGFVRQW